MKRLLLVLMLLAVALPGAATAGGWATVQLGSLPDRHQGGRHLEGRAARACSTDGRRSRTSRRWSGSATATSPASSPRPRRTGGGPVRRRGDVPVGRNLAVGDLGRVLADAHLRARDRGAGWGSRRRLVPDAAARDRRRGCGRRSRFRRRDAPPPRKPRVDVGVVSGSRAGQARPLHPERRLSHLHAGPTRTARRRAAIGHRPAHARPGVAGALRPAPSLRRLHVTFTERSSESPRRGGIHSLGTDE